MKVYELEGGAKLVTFNRYPDNRGWFSESWSNKWMDDLKITRSFVQANTVWTERKNTIRGLHAQSEPHQVAKMLQVIKGSILDVFVDAREGSDTFGKWFSVPLDQDTPQVLYVPQGFYHGYMTTSDDTVVCYQQDEFFTPASEHGLLWNDSTLNINWQLGNAVPIVSAKDEQQKTWQDATKF
jgi:dTDP-4-dehydrorhamnose 3,5-epimerase